jgi:hypothetical protein
MPKKLSDQEQAHREFAISCFNATWTYLEKEVRTKDEGFRMMHLAHASRYHWAEIGQPVHFARGDWLLARVYAELGFGVMAYSFARRSLTWCEEHDIGDFDLAFAFEAVARACAVSGDLLKAENYLRLATQAGHEIESEEDRTYFLQELQGVREMI